MDGPDYFDGGDDLLQALNEDSIDFETNGAATASPGSSPAASPTASTVTPAAAAPAAGQTSPASAPASSAASPSPGPSHAAAAGGAGPTTAAATARRSAASGDGERYEYDASNAALLTAEYASDPASDMAIAVPAAAVQPRRSTPRGAAPATGGLAPAVAEGPVVTAGGGAGGGLPKPQGQAAPVPAVAGTAGNPVAVGAPTRMPPADKVCLLHDYNSTTRAIQYNISTSLCREAASSAHGVVLLAGSPAAGDVRVCRAGAGP
jgi:hypothetical protein